MSTMVNGLSGSPWWAISSRTYGTSDIVRDGGHVFDNYSAGRALTPGAVQAVIIRALNHRWLPIDYNGVYMVYGAIDVSESYVHGANFCDDYCGCEPKHLSVNLVSSCFPIKLRLLKISTPTMTCRVLSVWSLA